jgi:hypothetical protein
VRRKDDRGLGLLLPAMAAGTARITQVKMD